VSNASNFVQAIDPNLQKRVEIANAAGGPLQTAVGRRLRPGTRPSIHQPVVRDGIVDNSPDRRLKNQ
jgi:hypothetical protein